MLGVLRCRDVSPRLERCIDIAYKRSFRTAQVKGRFGRRSYVRSGGLDCTLPTLRLITIFHAADEDQAARGWTVREREGKLEIAIAGKVGFRAAVAARSGLRSQPVAAALASSAEQIQVVRAPGFSHKACHIASINPGTCLQGLSHWPLPKLNLPNN